MMPKLLVLTAALVAAGVTGTTEAQAHRLSGHPSTLRGQLKLAKMQLKHDTLAGDHHWIARDRAYVKFLQRKLAPKRYLASAQSWLVNAFLCIHRYEGAWNDYGDPYWGGLQMDRSFMYHYGGWAIRKFGGFANVWPPGVQIAVAITAYNSGRGFGPWPNTARMCGLR